MKRKKEKIENEVVSPTETTELTETTVYVDRKRKIRRWYKKTNPSVSQYTFYEDDPPIEGYTTEIPLFGTTYQMFNEEKNKWVIDPEAESKTLVARKEMEIIQIKREIADRDYRALKAIKLGVKLDELYPGETQWYKEKIARINDLEHDV